jgi:transcriptional regulator with XRE-family HTH domain
LGDTGRDSGPKEREKETSRAGFRTFLKETRQARGLSIRQLARMSGVSNAYLSQVETGARGVPSPRILRRLARPLATTPTKLLEIAGYINHPQTQGPATYEIETFLLKENIHFTLEGKPVTREDIDAVMELLRKRHKGR